MASHLHSNQQRLTAHKDHSPGWRSAIAYDAEAAGRSALDGDLAMAQGWGAGRYPGSLNVKPWARFRG
jgi:hypothetical protein